MSLVEPLSGPKRGPAPGAGGGSAATTLERGPLRPVALASARTRVSTASAARVFRLVDGLVALAAIAVAVSAVGDFWTLKVAGLAPPAFAAWLTFTLLIPFRSYSFSPADGLAQRFARVLGAVTCGSVGAMALALSLGEPTGLVWRWTAATVFGLGSTQLLWWWMVGRWRAAGRITPNIVVVGATDNARKLIEAALASRDVAVLGVFDDRLARSPQTVAGVPVLGDTDALLAHPLLPYVDRIVITLAPWAQSRVRDLIDRLQSLPNPVSLFMDAEGADAQRSALARLTPGSGRSSSDEADQRAFAKRAQDLAIGVLALILFAPVMALIALAVKLESPGPVFFRQRRHGFNNETINVWKFRSMRADAADPTASRQVTRNDERVTRVGRIIRKLSLDELPQIFNVLMGEMSLVGPRPHAIGMKTAGEDSARLVAEYAWRHRMKPGLTGWAQINGSIGAVDTAEAVRRRVSLDVEYIERQSFWFDCYIMVMTLPALIRARNMVR